MADGGSGGSDSTDMLREKLRAIAVSGDPAGAVGERTPQLGHGVLSKDASAHGGAGAGAEEDAMDVEDTEEQTEEARVEVRAGLLLLLPSPPRALRPAAESLTPRRPPARPPPQPADAACPQAPGVR